MDLKFIFNDITFVWNDEKARQNPIKHKGVTFERAVEAFFDPFLVMVDASRNYEARDAVIGMDKGNYLLFVVHIQQENDMIIAKNGMVETKEIPLTPLKRGN